MRLQLELQKESEFNGRIEYVERNGHFQYALGHGANDWYVIESSANQSMWSDEEIMQVIAGFRDSVAKKNASGNGNHLPLEKSPADDLK